MSSRRSTLSTAPSAPLVEHVRRNLQRRCRVRRSERLLLAVSGGADSVALLDLVATIAPELELDIHVAHFDHALREGSRDDARLVGDRAQTYGFAMHSARWQTPRAGEAAARSARHAFLEGTAIEHSCGAIVLAHHLDDQIETALFRIERGSGLRGAGGMPWRRSGPVPVVRPLLDVPREALRAHLEAAGLTWRDDPTNDDRTRARNRIRHDILPVLRATLRAGWMERWSAQLEELRDVSAWIDRLARQLLHTAAVADDHQALDRASLQAAPEVVRRRALQLWLEAAMARSPDRGGGSRQRAQASRRQFTDASRIVRNGQSGQSLHLPGGYTLHLEQRRVRLEPPANDRGLAARATRRPGDHPHREGQAPTPYRLDVGPESKAEGPDAARRMGARALVQAPNRVPLAAEALLGAAALEPPFRCRRARPGDEIRLLGAPGTRKLHRVFQDREVPRTLRSDWPVVEDARGIIWVPGLGVAERARVRRAGEAARMFRIAVPDGAPPPDRADLVQGATES